MTEQEKREQAINEIEFVIRPQTCNDKICKLFNDKCSKCDATRIYDAGYRQEKETVKDILQRIYDNCYLSWIGKNYIVNLGKEFGVEVETR